MKYKEFIEEILKNKKVWKAYQDLNLPFEIGKMITEARILRGMTQDKLAELIKTQQPSIARIEKGEGLPSLRFLEKIANALKTELIPPQFAFMKTINNPDSVSTTNIINQKIEVREVIRYVPIFIGIRSERSSYKAREVLETQETITR